MSEWLDILGWGTDQLDDIRFVGYSYLKQGLYEVATSFFEALTVLLPDSPYDTQTLGALYLQQGKYKEAMHYLDKALLLDPTHDPSKLNRAKTLFLSGDKEQGILQAQKILSSNDPSIAKQAEVLLFTYS